MALPTRSRSGSSTVISSSRSLRFHWALSSRARESRWGAPHIFISHGVEDPVLPISQTSRQLIPLLRKAGYEVDYREFNGGHTIPSAMAQASVLKMHMS